MRGQLLAESKNSPSELIERETLLFYDFLKILVQLTDNILLSFYFASDGVYFLNEGEFQICEGVEQIDISCIMIVKIFIVKSFYPRVLISLEIGESRGVIN